MHLFTYFEVKTSLAKFATRFLVKHVLFDDEVFCLHDVNGVRLMELRFECDIRELELWSHETVKFAIAFEDLMVTQKHILAVSKLLLLKKVKTVSPFDVDNFVVYNVLSTIYDNEMAKTNEDEEMICIR